jgi:hypothetical protein
MAYSFSISTVTVDLPWILNQTVSATKNMVDSRNRAIQPLAVMTHDQLNAGANEPTNGLVFTKNRRSFRSMFLTLEKLDPFCLADNRSVCSEKGYIIRPGNLLCNR